MSRTSTRDVSRMSVAELKAVIIEHDGLSAELESIVEKRELRARAAAALGVTVSERPPLQGYARGTNQVHCSCDGKS